MPSFGTTFRPVPLVGPITVWFTENVNGINPSSAVVSRSIGDFDHGPPIAGTWVCRDRTAARTDCQTGTVMVARFWPTDPLAPRREYVVTLNPEFSLDVTDLAGNPFDRDEDYIETAPPT